MALNWDGLLTVGKGQRVGIFAGSGVGKSTLLGMIAQHVSADVNVIALIGERGREVREFIDKQLGSEGQKRSMVVVATSDQPALARIRAAHAAVTIAEYFRDLGRQVLLTMDSVTRLAMARREVGLAAGEPPTARGYTPSVFAELPQLCERCGTAPSGGSITALLTVLVEGDDMNDPIADSLRSILDGHVVLSRHIAHEGQYLAIDVLRSASRLLPDLTTASERELISGAIRHLGLLERNRQLVSGIDASDPDRRRKAFRMFMESTLARELGESMQSDPQFAALVDQVLERMQADPQLDAACLEAADILLDQAGPSGDRRPAASPR